MVRFASTVVALAATLASPARADDDRARAEARLRAASAESPRYEAHVEVELSAAAAGPALIEITYRVPCALWRTASATRGAVLVTSSPSINTASALSMPVMPALNR